MSGRWFRANFHVESFLRSTIQESHISHRSEVSGDDFHEWATISSNFSCREFLEIYNTREPHHSQKWAIWRPFSWVGDGFDQIFMSRVSWDLEYKRATSITEVSYLETIFMSGRCFRPNFHFESFSRSLIQESHIIHRSELSEDDFHDWTMTSSKFSSRELLEIYNTREPHHSQKWPIWRPFSWVGDDFVQIFMSRVFFRSIVQKSHIIHRSELSGDHFHEWGTIPSKFSCREFLEIYYTREPHQSQKWPIWRPFPWVGDDFVQTFMSSFLRSIIQESHIIHRSELSGDHFHEWAMFSSKFSCWEFLEIYNTREPHHSQKWAIWRPFSWLGDDFVQVFMSRVSRDL